MKIKFTFFIFLFFTAFASFSQKVVTLNALFTNDDAVLVPQAEGEWSIKGFDIPVSVHKAGDNFYTLKYGSSKNQSVFEAVFIKSDKEYFMDLRAILPDTIGDTDYRNSFTGCHRIYKVRPGKDTLEFSELNYTWFYDYIILKKNPLKFEWTDNGMLLTMKTSELKSFFSGQKIGPGTFENYSALIKKSSNIEPAKNTRENFPECEIPENISQVCLPGFPFKDGWLGADGDVSVPLNKTQTLFIFSDSFVGNKNQQARTEAEMKIVSNSVAVETCLPNGKTDVHYFWKNRYTDNPGPIFKSFTNRYKYWVNDAFMYKTCLYVLLEKIGPKQGVAPGDIFTFSSAGFTLAKITNPLAWPLQWQIELIPLPGFAAPQLEIRCHVIQGKFVYFFVTDNEGAQFLIRKSLDFIDNSEKPFEYYALNKSWKTGIKADDMDTLAIGTKANTVNYHNDLKHWVMVCDIKFQGNKIKIRTSSSLTGPWSEAKIVYECPEVTPGTAAYNKLNFCYLSRECIRNYDNKTHTMIITYDVNNFDFSEIKSNPRIYTPKIIAVSLKKDDSH